MVAKKYNPTPCRVVDVLGIKYFRESQALWVAKIFGGSSLPESGLALKVRAEGKLNHLTKAVR